MTKLGDLKRTGGIPTSALADAPVAGAPTTPLGQLRIARGEDAILPCLGPVYVQMLGHRQENQVESGVIAAMAEHRIPLTDIWVWTVDLERKARTLAFAIRARDDHAQPFGTVDEWLDMEDRVIFACYLRYGEIRDRLDPLAPSFTLNPERAKEIFEAFKKKDRDSLMSFGIDELASWLVSGDVPPSISPTPSSGSSGSSVAT